MKPSHCLLTFLVAIFSFSQSLAYPETMLILSPDETAVALVGPISEKQEFLEAFRGLPETVRYLHLESNGGRLDVALEFAREIKRREMTTFTKTNCQSACTFLFLAGQERWLHERAYVVFHRIQYFDPKLDKHQKQILQAYWQGRASQYYVDRGLSLELVDTIQSQHSTTFHGEDLFDAGYATRIENFSLENFPDVFYFKNGIFAYPVGYKNP